MVMRFKKKESIKHIDQSRKYNIFPVLVVIYDGSFPPQFGSKEATKLSQNLTHVYNHTWAPCSSTLLVMIN